MLFLVTPNCKKREKVPYMQFDALVLLVSLQPLVFGAMMHRDEAFDAIFSQHSKMVEKARAKNPET